MKFLKFVFLAVIPGAMLLYGGFHLLKWLMVFDGPVLSPETIAEVLRRCDQADLEHSIEAEVGHRAEVHRFVPAPGAPLKARPRVATDTPGVTVDLEAIS